MAIIAEARAINSKYMNATTNFGLAFRGGAALIDNERILAEAVQLDGIQILPSESYIERLPTLLNDLGPFKHCRANIFLPEGYKLRRLKSRGWEMLYKNKTLEERYPTPDPEPEPAPALALGWAPPDGE